MIVIPRGLARSFRALLRRCVSGRPRGPAPDVVFECEAGTLTVWARTADAGLACTAPAECDDGVLVVPLTVLAAVEGGGDDPVELTAGPGPRGEARWADRGTPRVHAFDAVPADREHRPPAPPAGWQAVPPAFLAALFECGRTTARESGRYALARVQVRGTAGQVVGTDGRTALVWGGFDLPVREDVLVPALPVFGARELASATPVRVGRTAAELVVAAGPWRVVLPVDAGGRYPDVAGVAPRTAPTVVGLDERDAVDLTARLPGLPGADAEGQPVTLDLDGGVAVLARDDATGAVEAVRLGRSPAAGPRARVVVDRRVLARALALGCVTVRVAPDKPVVFEGGDKTLVTVALDPALATGADPADPATNTTTERRTAVRHETNGHGPTGRPDPPATDVPDLLAAAEELRVALGEALAKAGRLVAALKARKRGEKALTQVWSSLKALNLSPGGQP